jgi:hypothetical protein
MFQEPCPYSDRKPSLATFSNLVFASNLAEASSSSLMFKSWFCLHTLAEPCGAPVFIQPILLEKETLYTNKVFYLNFNRNRSPLD